VPEPTMSKSDHRAIQTLHNLLQERFPLVFPKNCDDLRPLKIGIHADLIARLPDVDPPGAGQPYGRDGYLLALICGWGIDATIWTTNRRVP